MSIVTCGRPIQGGVNSGWKVRITSTRRMGTRSMRRSRDSRVVGSLQCTSFPYHQHGLPRRQALDLHQLGMERLLLALLCGELQGWIAVAGWDREQVCQQGDGLAEIIGTEGQNGFQLGKPLLGRILAAKPSRTFELGDARIKRAILVVRRAEIAQASKLLAAQPLQDGLRDARFANAGLARDQHHAAVATLCLLPPP